MRELQEAHFWAVEKEGQKRSRNVLLRNGCFPTLLTSKPCGGETHLSRQRKGRPHPGQCVGGPILLDPQTSRAVFPGIPGAGVPGQRQGGRLYSSSGPGCFSQGTHNIHSQDPLLLVLVHTTPPPKQEELIFFF